MYQVKVIIQSNDGQVIKQSSCEFQGQSLADIQRGIRIAANLMLEDELVDRLATMDNVVEAQTQDLLPSWLRDL